MGTLDDRNKPVDPYNYHTRQSIDDCSGEEWDSASRAYWAKMAIDAELEQDDTPQEEDKWWEDRLRDTDEYYSETYKMIEDEDTFEDIVKVMGPWEAISFCHGTALAILMDRDNFTNSASIEKAKTYLSRMARLINETRECNW